MQTILIVDDEAEIVELLEMLLDGDGLRVLGAYDGTTALRIAREEHPDLVISDVMMPGLDGRELCRAIKSDPQLASTSIVLMSAMTRLNLDDCHQDLFITKPFDIFRVAEQVRQLLARRQAPPSDQHRS